MQGRLVPKYQGRYQAHPIGNWEAEFFLAKEIGLNCIEFILDLNEANNNPLIRDGGIDEIKSVVNRSGVEVKTVCADYLMDSPLHSNNLSNAQYSQKLLSKLINNVSSLGVRDIVIPCVDKSSLNAKGSEKRFIDMLTPVLEVAEHQGINLSLETDLAPKQFKRLLNHFKSKRLTVNYDIGNSASLGFNPIEELDEYGYKITDIHIKDRLLGGGPIILGKGNADFDAFFYKLKDFDYEGPFIMQAYRDEEGVSIFKEQLEWIKPYLNA